MNPGDRLIVACDVSTAEELRRLVCDLRPYVGGFKVGLELMHSIGGPEAVRIIHEERCQVLYDAKLHDIPNTMAGAMRGIAAMKVSGVTVHASAGEEAISAAVDASGNVKVVGVTVLTSLGYRGCQRVYRTDVLDAVKSFAALLRDVGAWGIVCSAHEAEVLRKNPLFDLLKLVTPGIRPAWAASKDDQARITTPAQAIQNGTDYLVVGRPITNPPDGVSRIEATRRILDEMQTALSALLRLS